MIYGSFALMVWHWLPVVVLAWVWGGLFAVNMTLKEASMSRYPGVGAVQATLVVAASPDPVGRHFSRRGFYFHPSGQQ